jgi:hypothetical protein
MKQHQERGKIDCMMIINALEELNLIESTFLIEYY